MKPRFAVYACWGFAIAFLAVHSAIAWLSPLQGDDWAHLIWARLHHSLSDFVAEHTTFSDVAGYAVARSTLLHAIVTPIAILAIPLGAFVLATRRLPRPDAWEDVLGIVAISALIWLAQPRAGLVYFHRPYVATHVYGLAIALWLLAPYRCGWRPRGAWLPVLALAGLCAGSATRQLGIATLLALVYAMRRERAPWMWWGLATTAIGLVLGFADASFDFKGFRPGVELTMTSFYAVPVREGGELVSLVLAGVMIKLVLGALRPALAGDATPPDTRETLPLFACWLGLAVLALFGPRYMEATLLPATLALCIAAFPIITWLATSRVLRLAMIVLALAVHAVVWSYALATYVSLGAQFQHRLATLRAAPAGGVVTIDAYRRVMPDFWFFGEDWYEAWRRQRVAIELFGLRDIEYASTFRRMERNPHVMLRLETERITPEQLHAHAPVWWATDLAAARRQFTHLVSELQQDIGDQLTARLVVEDFPAFRELRGRPLLAALYDRGQRIELETNRTNADDLDRLAVVVPARFARAHPEVYALQDGKVSTITPEGRRYWVVPTTTERLDVIACDPQRCFLVDAFDPRL